MASWRQQCGFPLVDCPGRLTSKCGKRGHPAANRNIEANNKWPWWLRHQRWLITCHIDLTDVVVVCTFSVSPSFSFRLLQRCQIKSGYIIINNFIQVTQRIPRIPPIKRILSIKAIILFIKSSIKSDIVNSNSNLFFIWFFFSKWTWSFEFEVIKENIEMYIN